MLADELEKVELPAPRFKRQVVMTDVPFLTNVEVNLEYVDVNTGKIVKSVTYYGAMPK